MTKFNSVKAFFETETPKDIAKFIDKNLDISQQVYHLLKQKNWTQSDFAKALGKSTAEVSKWLSGTHNLTLKSIAKMEAVLDADIIRAVRSPVRTGRLRPDEKSEFRKSSTIRR